MTPSQRVHLVRAISEKLAVQERHIIDMTLRAFGIALPGYDARPSEPYIISTIETADEKVLIDLGTHVSVPNVTPAGIVVSDPGVWTPGLFRLFISHVSAHKGKASALSVELASLGISGFVAHEDIEPTAPWQTVIEAALHTADAMCALLTEGFHESNWTDQEVGFALARGILVIPIKYESAPYGFMGRIQAQPGFPNEKALAKAVFDLLLKTPDTRRKLVGALVVAFTESWSFQRAKDMSLILLNVADSLTDEMKRQILAGARTNRQISEAIGVPDRVAKLTAGLTSASEN